jgi:hypothetical protein
MRAAARLTPFLIVAGLVACDDFGPSKSSTTLCFEDAIGGFVYVRDEGDAGFARNNPWVKATTQNSVSFTFQAPKRMTLAIVNNFSSFPTLTLHHLTSDELGTLACSLPASGIAHNYSVKMTGIAPGKVGSMQAGDFAGVTIGDSTFAVRAFGDTDLVATLDPFGTGGGTEKILVRRAVQASANSALPQIDFNSAEAVVPASFPLTVTGATGQVNAVEALAVRGAQKSLVPVVDENGGVVTLFALPSALQIASDWYSVSVSTSPLAADARIASVRFKDVGARTIALGPDMSPITWNLSLTVPILTFDLPVQSEYGQDLRIDLVQPNASRGITMTMTKAFRGTASSWSLETPDPATLQSSALLLSRGDSISWFAAVSGGLLSSSTPLDQVLREVHKSGSLTPP